MDTLGIIRQLENDPGLRAQLRAVLLGDELLAMPAQLAQLIESQQRMLERQDRMEAVLTSLIESQQQIVERQDRMEAAFEAFAAATDARFQHLETDVGHLKVDVGHLKGSDLERRVRERPEAYFPDTLDDLEVLDGAKLNKLLATLDKCAQLSGEDRRSLHRADVIVSAHRGTERVTVVVEVSATLHADDITRAAKRAGIVNACGLRAVAMAIGEDLGGESVAALAAEHGVELVATT